MRRNARLPLLVGLILTASGMASGETAIQTDWAGGYGVPGPVIDWGSCFATSEAIAWAALPGNLTLVPAPPIPNDITTNFAEPAGTIAVDIDEDDDLDIVSVAYTGNEVAWWENDGSGGGWTKHRIAVGFEGPVGLCAVDINDDDHVDIAACAEDADEVAWWANNGSGTAWTRHEVDPAINSPFSVRWADYDNDDDPDLSAAAYAANDIVWWENTDGLGGSWTRHTVDANLSGAWGATPVDINEDNETDILAAAYGANQICWYENLGGGASWSKRVVDWDFDSPVSIRAHDMDGDDDIDILASSYSGTVAWWENGGSRWTKHVIAEGLDVAFCVFAQDLDGDQDPDVISSERNSDRVWWWENADGVGTLWIQHLVDETGDGPNGLLAADINNDTQQNIIVAFSFSHTIRWYDPADAFTDNGFLETSILDAGDVLTDWGTIDWTCQTPANTSVTVEVRASSDPETLGAWSIVGAPGDDLSGYVQDEDRYIQCRISLGTTDSAASPTFEELQVYWNQAGAVDEGDAGPGGFGLRPALPTPSPAGRATIQFTVPRVGDVELVLFDPEGRRVRTLAEGTYEPGEYEAAVTGLARGVYLCRLNAAGFRAIRKVIVN